MFWRKTKSDLEKGAPATVQRIPTGSVIETTLDPTASLAADRGQKDAYDVLLERLQRPKEDAGHDKKTSGKNDKKTTPLTTSALEVVHRLNLQQAKLDLYTDYYLLQTNEVIPFVKGEQRLLPTNLGESVSRYSKAVADYKAFADNECAAYDSKTRAGGYQDSPTPVPYSFRALDLEERQDSRLLELAARKAAMQKYKLQLKRKDNDEGKIDELLTGPRNVIDLQEGWIIMELSNYSIQIFTKGSKFMDENRRMARQIRKFLRRLFMALFGGLILIAPMLIMRLHPDLLTVVLTTSIFIIVVGIILAATMTEGESRDILAAAAAYAAVLVVFVGQGTVIEASSWSNRKIAGVTVGAIVGTALIGGLLSVFWYDAKMKREGRPDIVDQPSGARGSTTNNTSEAETGLE